MVERKGFSIQLFFLLFAIIISLIMNTLDAKSQQFAESPINTYDTLFVYDTIWVYETVYDTIWIFDTVYVSTTTTPLKKLNPVEVNNIYYSPFYSLTAKTLTARTIYPKKRAIKRNKFYKFRYDQKKKKKESKQKKRSSRYSGKLTFNPTKGKFDPHLFSRGIYSIEAYCGSVFQNTQYSYPVNSENIVDIESAIKDMSGIEYGARLNYNLFQYTLQCGIGISQLNEGFNYIQTNYNVDSTIQSKEISKIIEWTDTLHFIDVDRLIVGDTVWITYCDTYDKLITEDSIYYSHDTTITKTPKSEIVSHYLLEVPLIFSYEWGFAKTAIQFKLGGVNQFHMFSKGETFNSSGMVEDINKNTNFTKYNFAIYTGIGFLYDFSRKVSISFDAYYKYPLRKFSTSNSVILNKQTYGANVSIRYHF